MTANISSMSVGFVFYGLGISDGLLVELFKSYYDLEGSLYHPLSVIVIGGYDWLVDGACRDIYKHFKFI